MKPGATTTPLRRKHNKQAPSGASGTTSPSLRLRLFLPAPPPPAVPAASSTSFRFGGQDAPTPSWTTTTPIQGPLRQKLYNKGHFHPSKKKFDGEADNLAVFPGPVLRGQGTDGFNWHRLITVPIDDGTTRNLLTHYGQVVVWKTPGHTQ